MVARNTLQETTVERAAREGANVVAQSEILSAIRSFFEIFGLGGFFDAIVGSFSGNQHDTDEVPTGTVPAPSDRPTGTAQAEALLQMLGGNEKLRVLMAQYQGRIPAPISPFSSLADITSHYGHRDAPHDSHGHIVGSSNHGGIDAKPRTPEKQTLIHSTMPGVVVYSGTQRDKDGNVIGYGNWVEVAAIDGKRYRYAHLANKVSTGTVLDQGDVLGVMGDTGHRTGAHLHYEVRDASGSNTLAPEINGRAYAKDDRSYRNTSITPADPQRYASKRSGQDSLVALREGMPKFPITDNSVPRAPIFVRADTKVGGVLTP